MTTARWRDGPRRPLLAPALADVAHHPLGVVAMNGYRCQLCTAIVWERDLEEHPCRAGWATVNLAPDEDETWEDARDERRLMRPKRCAHCRELREPGEYRTRRVKGRVYLHAYCDPCRHEIAKVRWASGRAGGV